MRKLALILGLSVGLLTFHNTFGKAIIRVIKVYTGSLHKYTKIGFFYERIICSGNAPIECPVTVGAGAFYFPPSDNEYINALSEQVAERLNKGEYEGRLVVFYGNSNVPYEILLKVEHYAYLYLNGNDEASNHIDRLLKGHAIGLAVWKYSEETNQLEVVIIYNDGK